MSTKTARRRRAAAQKAADKTRTTPTLSLVKTIPRLPQRIQDDQEPPIPGHPEFTREEAAAARAALAACLGGIKVPVMAWTSSYGGGVQQHLPDGTLLHHPGIHGAPFSATIPCLLGAHHTSTVYSARGLAIARHAADTCQQPHADLSAIEIPAVADLTAAFAHPDTEATLSMPIPLQQAKGASTPSDGSD